MREVFARIDRVAGTMAPVLVVGESGTGKELVARAIHTRSRRRNGPFVPVHTGAIPRELIGSELFGHEKGSFTGAFAAAEGKFEAAAGGTVFLDEVGTMDTAVQVSLLRVLETYRFTRVGGRKEIEADVRIVAATNKDLRAEVAAGRFREDLFYRLNVIAVTAPPLRARREDIPLLVDHFLGIYCMKNNRPRLPAPREMLSVLCDYSWPGNVRELENVIERGVVLTTGTQIGRELIPDHVRTAPSFHVPHLTVPPEGISLRDVIANFERRLIESTLESTAGVQKEAARLLGLKPTTLNEMIKRHNILLPRERDRDRRGKDLDEPAEKITPA